MLKRILIVLALLLPGLVFGQVVNNSGISGVGVNAAQLGSGNLPAGVVSSAGNALVDTAGTATVSSKKMIENERVVTASGAITMSTTDYDVCAKLTTPAAIAINLPATPVTGNSYQIADCAGNAATYNLTVTPAAGLISGASTAVINANYGAWTGFYNGTSWETVTSSSNGSSGITALTGDVTASGPGSAAATIAAGAVTLAKQANLAANSVECNNTGSPTTPIACTVAQFKTLLALSLTTDVTGTLQAAQEPAHTGDVTNSATSLALTIASSAVTLAKQANFAASSLQGNPTGSPAAPSAITLGTNLSFAGTVLNASGSGGASLSTANTWTAPQTFTNSDLKLLGSSTGANTFTAANSSASNYTTTVPANTGTLAELNLAQTYAAVQTFTNSDLALLGSSTGATTFTSGNSSATNYTVTVPAGTGNLLLDSVNGCTIVGSTSGQVCTSTGATSAPTFQSGVSIPSLNAVSSVATGDLFIDYSAADSAAEKATLAQVTAGVFATGVGTAHTFTAAQTFAGGIGGYTVNVGTIATTPCTLTSTGNAGCSGITNGVGDCGTFIKFTDASAVTVTIPATLAVGCQVAIEQGGAGKVSVNGSAVTAATLHSAHSYTGTSAQYAVIGVTIDANSGGSSAIAVLTGDGS
jgi:hypothetical protein